MTHSHYSPAILLLAAFVLLPTAKSDPLNGGTQWRALPNVQTALGVTNYAWNGDSICFSNEQNLIRFYQGRRKFDVNGTTVWLNAQPDGSVTSGDWRLAATDLDLLQLSVLPKEEGALKPVRVMLDPGHGGEDDGASSKDPAVKEKDLTLAMALKLGAHLTAAGLQVVYTRTNDTALALDERSVLARRSKADLFVSIHLNAAANSDSSGIQTHILPPAGCPITESAFVSTRDRVAFPGNRHDEANMILGYYLQKSLIKYTRLEDRGVRRSRFYVIRNVDCPAALVECGFISSRNDRTKIMTSAYRDNVVRGIAEGILTYLNMVKRAQALNP